MLYTGSLGPDRAADNNCQGFDLLDDELDKIVAKTDTCNAVEVMKEIQTATLCDSTKAHAFGKATAMFKKGKII